MIAEFGLLNIICLIRFSLCPNRKFLTYLCSLLRTPIAPRYRSRSRKTGGQTASPTLFPPPSREGWSVYPSAHGSSRFAHAVDGMVPWVVGVIVDFVVLSAINRELGVGSP